MSKSSPIFSLLSVPFKRAFPDSVNLFCFIGGKLVPTIEGLPSVYATVRFIQIVQFGPKSI